MAASLSLAFYKGPETLDGRLIRWWTKSPYSHCAVVFNDIAANSDLVVEAMAGVGVRQRWVSHWDPKSWDRIDLAATQEKIAEIYAWTQSELGCKYDWSGLIWSQILGIPREHPDKWFCSEFDAAAAEKAGVLGTAAPCTFSPGSLYNALT